MAKPVSPKSEPQRLVPATPEPTAETAASGMDEGRQLARRYMADLVRLLAGICLSERSEAALHTRVLAAKQIIELGGSIPQAVPPAPQLQGDGGEPS